MLLSVLHQHHFNVILLERLTDSTRERSLIRAAQILDTGSLSLDVLPNLNAWHSVRHLTVIHFISLPIFDQSNVATCEALLHRIAKLPGIESSRAQQEAKQDIWIHCRVGTNAVQQQ